MRETTILNNGNENILKGGAMLIQDSAVTITDSKFGNNIAQSGAAIYFH